MSQTKNQISSKSIKISELRIAGTPFRVGIVSQYEPPYTNLDCFTSFEEKFILKQTKSCIEKPGASVEFIVTLLMDGIGASKMDFIPASTWGEVDPTSLKATGLVGQILNGTTDFTVPQLTMTPLRRKVVSFGPPLVLENAPCFMICGKSNVYGEGFGTFQNFFSRDLIGLSAGCMLVTFLWFVVLHRYNLMDWSNTFHTSFSAILVLLFSEPAIPARGRRGFWTFFLLSAMCFIIISEGVLKGKLLNSFLPRQRFPFNNLKDMSLQIEKKQWNFYGPSKEAAVMFSIRRQEKFASLQAALTKNPPSYISNPETMIKLMLKDPKSIYYRPSIVVSWILSAHRDLDDKLQCLCSSLGSTNWRMNSFAMRQFSPEFQDRIAIKVAMLRETGIVNWLERKYDLNTQDHFVKPNGDLQKKKSPRQAEISGIKLHMIISAIAFYWIGQAISLVWLGLECFCYKNNFYQVHR